MVGSFGNKRSAAARIVLSFSFFVFFFFASSSAALSAEKERDPLFAVNEGWGWPVVVVPPPAGWESGDGETIKLAMRAAEREISRRREGIRGREVIFMFANLDNAKEIPKRAGLWRNMKAAVIVSFGGSEYDDELQRTCALSGPSVLFSGGENLKIINTATGEPYPFLFALDLPYYARANALALGAAAHAPGRRAAVVSDVLSDKIAKGARLTESLLKAAGVPVYPIWVSAARGDQFTQQVGEAEASGAASIISWLEGMGTLSLWRRASLNHRGTRVFYAGERQNILLDAEGLTLVDKNAVLERNERGKHDIILKLRDMFGQTPADPVLAAKAYALAKWVIAAYANEADVSAAGIARALEAARDIPLMDETLSINRRTHRPTIRQYGVLTVRDRKYLLERKVDVGSSEVTE